MPDERPQGYLAEEVPVRWRPDSPDVAELLRYNRRAAISVCKHPRAKEHERGDGATYYTCPDCPL